jgi:spermidine synthase
MVVLSGIVLMVLEIAGGTMLAPYFGSTVFVWAAIISIFMLGLSLGYSLGGRADSRSRSLRSLSVLLAAAGAWLLLAGGLGSKILNESIPANISSLAAFPLLLTATAFLFFFPVLAIGMITPLAVAAATIRPTASGTRAGKISAWSTLGGLSGALAAVFGLPLFAGQTAILCGCGSGLLILAGLTLLTPTASSHFISQTKQKENEFPRIEKPNSVQDDQNLFTTKDAISADPEITPVTPRHEVKEIYKKPWCLRVFVVHPLRKPINAHQPFFASGSSGLLLSALVFSSGAAVMALEIIGGAWLALYFGSSVYVWGAVISLFLVCLALGYGLGGKLADYAPDFRILAGLIMAAGILTGLVPLAMPRIGQAMAIWQHGPHIGFTLAAPFLAALILFSVPVLLLAMVTPYGVRMASGKNDDRAGQATGRVFALSTLGSVCGVLAADFLLLADFSSKSGLITGLAAVLTFLTLATLLLHGRPRFGIRSWSLLTAVSLIMVFLIMTPKPQPVSPAGFDETVTGISQGWNIVQLKEDPDCVVLRRLRATAESPYHHLAVIDEKALAPGSAIRGDDGRSFPVVFSSVNGNSRVLLFDCFVQSSVLLDAEAVSLRAPYQSDTLYSDVLHLPFLLEPGIRDVLMIGGGGGTAAMLLKQSYAVAIDVVEIDPAVVAMARQWFGLRPDARLRVHVADGRMYLRRSAKTYDLIVLDAFSAGGRIPFHLTTREFFKEVRARLNPDGLLLMNLIGAVDGKPSRLFRAVYRTLAHTFGRQRVAVFPLAFMPEWNREEPRNLLLLAGGPVNRMSLRQEEWRQRLGEEDWRTRAPLLRAIVPQQLAETDPALQCLKQSPILTDDFAPVDLLAIGLGLGEP